MSNKVKIITDSTVDLMPETLKKYDIDVVPLFVNFEEESYLDGVNIDTKTLYNLVDEKKILPKTAAYTINGFYEIFKKYYDQGYDVIYTGISSKMSSTFNNANIAKNMIDEIGNRIFIVDSMNLSSGIGLTVLKAAKMVESGELSTSQIVRKMEEIIPLVRSQFAIEKMDYLYKGGRCSSIAHLLGTVLKIKPIISVRDGKMDVMKKPRGKMKVALDALLNIIEKDKEYLDGDVVMVTHSMGDEYSIYLKTELEKIIQTKEIMITNAGCVISSHCGKGTIGILYVLKK